MKTILLLLALLPLQLAAVEQPSGGEFAMGWRTSFTNAIVDTCVWESTNGGVKWKQIGETRGTNFAWTNRSINSLTRYAITQIPWMPSGSQDIRPMTEMVLLHWAPTGTNQPVNASSYVHFTALYVPAGRRVKTSSDLKTWDDFLTPTVLDGTNEITNATVRLRYSTAPDKPVRYFTVPTNALPPLP